MRQLILSTLKYRSHIEHIHLERNKKKCVIQVNPIMILIRTLRIEIFQLIFQNSKANTNRVYHFLK